MGVIGETGHDATPLPEYGGRVDRSVLEMVSWRLASEFVRRHGLWVRDVEAQAFGRNERALLLDVGAEDGAQRLVNEVSGGVVRPRCRTPGVIDDHVDAVIRFEAA